MADVFTGASADVAGGQLTNQVITAYNRSAFFALRAGLVFDQLFNVKPGNLTSPGSPVKWVKWTEMTAVTAALNEITDPDAVALADSLITVTPAEYGNVVKVSTQIRQNDFLLSFMPDISNLLNYNMVDSLDGLARTAANASGTAVTTDGGLATALTSTDIITADLIRQQAAALRKASAAPVAGNSFAAIIHPDVAYDLKSETGDGSWVVPSSYTDTGVNQIFNDEIGTFGGFRFMESPRALLAADGGATTTDIYTTYFVGANAYAKVDSISPHIVAGPVVDALMRTQPLGWYAYQGWGGFESAASRRLISASSIGANV